MSPLLSRVAVVLLLALGTPHPGYPAPRAAAATAAGAISPAVEAIFREAPLSFERNLGQADPRVEYLARGPGYTLFLTGSEAVLAVRRGGGGPAGTAAALRMRFIGANPAPKLEGLAPLPGKSHYFIGNDPRKWRTDIPHYGRVTYHDVYPGIDVVYYGHQGRLEYDLVVAPGTDPGIIKLALDGGETLELEAGGDLVVRLAGGELRLHRPLLYQGADGGHREIAGRYRLLGPGQVGIQVAAYDVSRPLVIDPVLSYSTFLGGTGNDLGYAIAADSAGHVYVTGETTSTDFPLPPVRPRWLCGVFGALCPFQRTNAGSSDVFVAKLNPAAGGPASLVYVTYLGGAGADRGNAIAVDGEGHAYVTGDTASDDFPIAPCVTTRPPPGGFPGPAGCFPVTVQPSRRGGTDAFVTKLDRFGSRLLYSTYLGGTDNDVGTGIAVDAAGHAHVTGRTVSANFPTTAGAFDRTCGTDGTCNSGGGYPISDAFVAKLNPAGSALLYSTYLGGAGDDGGAGIAVGPGGAFVTGRTSSADFPTTPGAFRTTYGGGFGNAFVTKLDPTGSTLAYSTYLGGSRGDAGNAIAVDAGGHAYVTGLTTSPDFPVANAFQAVYGGFTDAFVAKLTPTGSALVYSTFLGGVVSSYEGTTDTGNGIAVDAGGNAYVAGSTISLDDPDPSVPTPANEGFPLMRPAQPVHGGARDAFVARLNPSGSLTFSTYLGGLGWEDSRGVVVDAAGNIYVTGQTNSTSGFPVVNPYQGTNHIGPFDAFVAKITGRAAGFADLAVTKTATPAAVTEGNPLTYTVAVTNHGPDPATGVTVIETLSPEVTFVSATSSQGSCSIQGAVVAVGKTVICNLGNLAVGGSATVVIDVTPNRAAP
jgi:uncharacterized repeat protein (TIGR01451 family)